MAAGKRQEQIPACGGRASLRSLRPPQGKQNDRIKRSEAGKTEGSARNPPKGNNGSSKLYVAGEPATHKDEHLTLNARQGNSRSLVGRKAASLGMTK
jgi:hypothetical protein